MHYNTKDLSGQTFGYLTVISVSPKRLCDNRISWICKCICNKDVLKTSRYLKHKNIKNKSCGCTRGLAKKLQIKNGTKMGKLTVLDTVESKLTPNGDNHTTLKCICDCNTIKHVNAAGFLKGSYLSCGKSECKKDFDPKNSVINHTYKTYKYNAKKRDINFNISKKDVENIIFKPCYYCGVIGGNTSNLIKNKPIKYNGIDRHDNFVGYQVENIVPCCGTCNIMKNNKSYRYFINHIEKIFNNLKDGETTDE